ncbi:MAG: response regulator [Elusimicrobia bacterium]|nr:response regulator [Elusimicrobiota bacterium]
MIQTASIEQDEKPWTLQPDVEPALRPRARVLLVDDEADMLTVLGRWLSPHYETVALRDGRRLLETALEFGPHLIILDLSMPDADGYSLCERLREVGRLRSVPVLFVTGRAADTDFLRHLDCGGNGYLQKPVEREELLRHVRALLA